MVVGALAIAVGEGIHGVPPWVPRHVQWRRLLCSDECGKEPPSTAMILVRIFAGVGG
jgi:hypothetical protein